MLDSCVSWFNSQTGEIEDISPKLLIELNEVITSMAESSLRTLCLGYKKLGAHDDLETKDKRGVY